MNLDKKKVFETCKTILSSADLDTITEKKVRRQIEEELGFENKILDNDPYKSTVKEIINSIINDLQQTSESSRLPQVSKAKITVESISTSKKSRKSEAKSKESSKELGEDLSNQKPLNKKARIKHETSPISDTQASKSKISKTHGPKIVSTSSKLTNREEQSKKSEDISEVDDATNKSSKNVSQANKLKIKELNKEVFSEEESETALHINTKSKISRTNKNKEKRKPNISRARVDRVKKKINASSDTDDNKSSVKNDLMPVSIAKESVLEGSMVPLSKQSRRKIDTVENGGAMIDQEKELLLQKPDIIESHSNGDDVESDNTIKEDPAELEDINVREFQDNSKSIGEVGQEPNGLKAESASPKRTIDSVGEDSSDLSSLEDDKPRKKKPKSSKSSTKSVSNKPVNKKLPNDKSANKKSTGEKYDKRIKNLKSFILKCGVRKNWTKVFADCDTDIKKIRKLKQILVDLGVEGRPTIEKCRKAKKNLELEAELGEMDVHNIISDDIKETRKARASRGIFNASRRQVSHVTTRSSPEYDDSYLKDVHSDSE